MKRNMIIDSSYRCSVRIEKREGYYVVEIVTDNHEITVYCDKLSIIDKRPKPVKPLTNFVR